MYIFINSDLGMSPGKVAAQASHAAVEAYRISNDTLVEDWYNGGHYTKLVMDGGNSSTLLIIERYLKERDFKVKLIIDEGRTEIARFSPTALGVEVVDRDDPHTAATFESFSTLKAPSKLRTPWRRASLWDLLRGRAQVITGDPE
jgi:PTH2 family peptidyl-tRNA hydrolase